jgi:aryl-alcohol dehydrogenase-like predicted oxidoreductase
MATELRNIGSSGLRVSAVGLGCNNFGFTVDAGASRNIIHRALDLGVTLFDTAPVYGASWGDSERILGAALGPRRKDAVIVSKFGLTPGFGRDSSGPAIEQGVEDSLRRLDTDYIDLLLLHWPDPSTPMTETLGALDRLVRAGKVRDTGCCNLPAWEVVEAIWLARTGGLHEFAVAQDEYSLVNRRAEGSLLPALRRYDRGFMPYAPLANGLLTGKYSGTSAVPADTRLTRNQWNTGERCLTPENLSLVDGLSAFSRACGHSLLELAVSWLLNQAAVCSVIAGATGVEQLEQNVRAAGWRLSEREREEVDRLCGVASGAA